MSRLTSRHHGPLSRLGGGWELRSPVVRRGESFGGPSGLLVAGIVAVGAGVLAWHFLGPDGRRYIKIINM